jgi:hypothetical protein
MSVSCDKKRAYGKLVARCRRLLAAGKITTNVASMLCNGRFVLSENGDYFAIATYTHLIYQCPFAFQVFFYQNLVAKRRTLHEKPTRTRFEHTLHFVNKAMCSQ